MKDKFPKLTAVEAVLVELGATKSAGIMYRWDLQTKAGLLELSMRGDWLFSRFDDVDAACAMFGLKRGVYSFGAMNTCSGKWNHLLGEDPQRAAEKVRELLARVLPEAR